MRLNGSRLPGGATILRAADELQSFGQVITCSIASPEEIPYDEAAHGADGGQKVELARPAK